VGRRDSRLSGAFRKYPASIRQRHSASAGLQFAPGLSEGTAIASPSAITRLIMEAQTRADDGMDLIRVETFQAPPRGLPSEAD